MIRMDFSSLKETKPHEYAMRFLFGGICTVLAGVIAKGYGPGLGGLFLAFPTIFPAGLSLIEGHETKRKAEHGFNGEKRGRLAASIDAIGASLGCIGLMAFAVTLRMGLPQHRALYTEIIATSVWIGISTLLWALHRHRPFISERLPQINKKYDSKPSAGGTHQHQRRCTVSMHIISFGKMSPAVITGGSRSLRELHDNSKRPTKCRKAVFKWKVVIVRITGCRDS